MPRREKPRREQRQARNNHPRDSRTIAIALAAPSPGATFDTSAPSRRFNSTTAAKNPFVPP